LLIWLPSGPHHLTTLQEFAGWQAHAFLMQIKPYPLTGSGQKIIVKGLVASLKRKQTSIVNLSKFHSRSRTHLRILL